MSKQYIYVGEKDGKHWAVKPDPSKRFGRADHWNTESEKEHLDAEEAWLKYLESLPRIECHPSLVKGLKEGGRLPDCREQKQRMNFATDFWVNCTDGLFDAHADIPNRRRIILLPVEAKQEQGIKYKLGDEVKHKADAAPFIVVGIRETELEIKGDWSGGTHPCNLPSWVSIDEVNPFDYSKMKTYSKPQEQG